MQTPALNSSSAKFGQVENYIDADYECSDGIADLRMAVVNAINPIRDGMREKDKVRMLVAS